MPKIKLTNEQVSGIRYAFLEEEMTLGALALLYQVSRTQIWRIVNNRQRKKCVNVNPELTPSLRSGVRGEKRVNDAASLAIIKFLRDRGSLAP